VYRGGVTTRRTVIEDKAIPEGFEVVHLEERGYDSPDRYYEVYYHGMSLGSFGRRGEAIKACHPPPQLQVTVASDDIITFGWGGEEQEVGAAEMAFKVTMRDGLVLPLKVDYSSWGWQFTLTLPEGTRVEPILPEDEDDQVPEDS